VLTLRGSPPDDHNRGRPAAVGGRSFLRAVRMASKGLRGVFWSSTLSAWERTTQVEIQRVTPSGKQPTYSASRKVPFAIVSHAAHCAA
jgi:hypothetical protein